MYLSVRGCIHISCLLNVLYSIAVAEEDNAAHHLSNVKLALGDQWWIDGASETAPLNGCQDSTCRSQ